MRLPLFCLFVTLMLAVCALQPVHAQGYQSGNELYEDCNSRESDTTYYQRQAFCMAYIVGAVDMVLLMQAYEAEPFVCIRPGVTQGQLTDMVKGELLGRANVRDFTAAAFVASVLASNFPCS